MSYKGQHSRLSKQVVRLGFRVFFWFPPTSKNLHLQQVLGHIKWVCEKIVCVCVCVSSYKPMGPPVSAGIGSSTEDRWMDTIQMFYTAMYSICTHCQNTHTTVHNAWFFRVLLPPSLWRSCLSWPVSFLMANLRYTTWTRPFTSTSCWPFSRGSMKNSPLSVRIRPDWKKRKDSFRWVTPASSKRMVTPLEPVNTVGTVIWKEERHGGSDEGRPFKNLNEIY